jgi:hypothetical protein
VKSPELLNSDDQCRRRAFYEQRWQPPQIHPTEALYQSIEFGLQSSASDPGDAASDRLMELATSRGLDSNQTDLLGEAEHLAGIASFVTWLLRTGPPWKRPEPLELPNGTIWTPGAFLDTAESHLRRVVLCSRWDAYRQVEAEHDWRTLEAAIYGVPMDLVVIVLGQQRDGRRHGPLTKGWTHPVSKGLRFRKRDGSGFDANWTPVFREQSNFTRDQWLDAIVEDGLLAELVLIHRVEPESGAISHLAQAKLALISATQDAPDPQLSRCFSRFEPCPFRAACPRGEEPSESLGFLPVTSCP